MPRRTFNLELDLRRAAAVIDRIRHEDVYAQNWYAALCNNDYAPKDVWGILSNVVWSCSWRYAAEMISDIREDESHRDWYGSGSGFHGIDFCGFVEESYVTEEIESDINDLGWILITNRFIRA